MPIPTSKSELVKVFTELGASSPELWANSQIEEGIPQLLRFLFLKSAWHYVVAEGDSSWIDEEIELGRSRPQAPYAGLSQTLEKLRNQGVADEDLTTIARCLQAQMIFSLGYLLDAGPSEQIEEIEDVTWGLFQVDDNGNPFGPAISGLHESVLELDPTGREMRPIGSP
ncbi:hypothetical protein [Massilia sp. 9096]|uniref:hypothetical protein n=1 Tax=Massilia sp. 9096 TaxID=1500894 RepID=UPI0005637841|nr:hypothetical protein [Massilia sp. 9096]